MRKRKHSYQTIPSIDKWGKFCLWLVKMFPPTGLGQSPDHCYGLIWLRQVFARGHQQKEAFWKGAIVGSVIHNPSRHCNKLLSCRFVGKNHCRDRNCTSYSPFALLGNEETERSEHQYTRLNNRKSPHSFYNVGGYKHVPTEFSCRRLRRRLHSALTKVIVGGHFYTRNEIFQGARTRPSAQQVNQFLVKQWPWLF